MDDPGYLHKRNFPLCSQKSLPLRKLGRSLCEGEDVDHNAYAIHCGSGLFMVSALVVYCPAWAIGGLPSAPAQLPLRSSVEGVVNSTLRRSWLFLSAGHSHALVPTTAPFFHTCSMELSEHPGELGRKRNILCSSIVHQEKSS